MRLDWPTSIAALALGFFVAAQGAAQPVLLGSSQFAELFSVDVTSGASTFIGFMPLGLATEIEFDPLTSRLLAEQTDGGTGLFTIDPATGAPLGVVNHPFGALNGLEFVGPTLYGTFIFGPGAPSELVIVDTLTGALTPVGPTGLGPISGLAFDPSSNVMYGVTAGGAPASLVTIDLLTGAATPIGPTGLDRIGSIELASDGNLYGGLTAFASLFPNHLVQIDLTTGAATVIGDTGFSITGLTSTVPPDLGSTSIEVSKTASFDGRVVSGTISITNTGENPAVISAMADSLEVHFPRKGRSTPPPLPGGSTPNWFKVADVPVAKPGPIPVGETVEIDYSFDLCAAADFAGANAMRNVVAVTLANKPEKARKDTVVTRSESFKPQAPECPVGPVTEDLSPCFANDFWEFDVTAGQTVFIEADTVDAATAADLCFFGNCGGVDFFGADDDFSCTFPPPAFSCPRDTFVATTSGTCTVEVRTCSSACADPGMANYSLTVQRDGSFADLTLVGDDL